MPTHDNETPDASADATVIEEFRAHRGKAGGPFEGRDLVLLTTTSAASGTPRTTVLDYVRRGESLLVVASGSGAPSHPAWYRDLLAHPVVGVEIGTWNRQMLAVPDRTAPSGEPLGHALPASAARVPLVVVLEAADPEVWEGRPREVRTLADKVMEVHTWLRGQLRQVKAETDAHFAARAAHQGPGEPPAPGLGLQIRQRCLAFCQALEFHHTSEDDHLFPGIARYHPELGAVFDRLRDEHRAVARIQRDLAALLAGVGVADAERFRAELAAMSDELNAHFDYEEKEIVPLLADVPWPPAPPPAAEGGAAAGTAE
ncbi:nitroreductase/quinone reductase family protein [Streptomyces sp. OR43]|uniref:nitroreductase/quinone reductase family protein n=1 Tax=Streptomyces sp. or43 TaxID=2478957 RepID=UPI0011CD76B7|nr:nitroreductase/quinone reductase family protein [Streptomyces sp. or43]TXS34910.1 nitroreductase family deazaflavin-dependent oxidoreductase [Streptomyces sp. or43]